MDAKELCTASAWNFGFIVKILQLVDLSMTLFVKITAILLANNSKVFPELLGKTNKKS